VREAEPLASGISAALAYPRFRASILTLFSIAALLLSAVGLHGVLAQLVQQRTSEFGIRRAIGAQTRDLILLIARQGGIPVLAGAAAGLACAVGFSRILGSLLYGIEPTDPRMLAAVLGVVLLAGAFGAAVPALRAARVDPMTALRND
jgi:ABC-type antimicrobial peptide transport system permease subunit